MTIYHKHHIVPRHMGGSDDSSNIVELTPKEHAEAHKILYEKYGHWQDKVAWRGLAGLITHEQAIREMYDARKGSGNTFYGKKHTEETKLRISKSRKGKGIGLKQSKEWIGKRKMIGDKNPRFGKPSWNKGTRFKWITNGITSKQINILEEIPEGWTKGRGKLK